MTQEEKAQSIVCFHCNQQSCDGPQTVKSCPKNKEVNNLLEMARWKDKQFKQILQVIYSKTLSIEKDAVIEQIYKKLFGEDLDTSELEKDELKNILEKIKNVEL